MERTQYRTQRFNTTYNVQLHLWGTVLRTCSTTHAVVFGKLHLITSKRIVITGFYTNTTSARRPAVFSSEETLLLRRLLATSAPYFPTG